MLCCHRCRAAGRSTRAHCPGRAGPLRRRSPPPWSLAVDDHVLVESRHRASPLDQRSGCPAPRCRRPGIGVTACCAPIMTAHRASTSDGAPPCLRSRLGNLSRLAMSGAPRPGMSSQSWTRHHNRDDVRDLNAAAGSQPLVRNACSIWSKKSSAHTRRPRSGSRRTVSPAMANEFCRRASPTTFSTQRVVDAVDLYDQPPLRPVEVQVVAAALVPAQRLSAREAEDHAGAARERRRSHPAIERRPSSSPTHGVHQRPALVTTHAEGLAGRSPQPVPDPAGRSM